MVQDGPFGQRNFPVHGIDDRRPHRVVGPGRERHGHIDRVQPRCHIKATQDATKGEFRRPLESNIDIVVGPVLYGLDTIGCRLSPAGESPRQSVVDGGVFVRIVGVSVFQNIDAHLDKGWKLSQVVRFGLGPLGIYV